MLMSRRGLIVGGAVLIAAPAIVRASSLMPVRASVQNPMVFWRVSTMDANGNLAWTNWVPIKQNRYWFWIEREYGLA